MARLGHTQRLSLFLSRMGYLLLPLFVFHTAYSADNPKSPLHTFPTKFEKRKDTETHLSQPEQTSQNGQSSQEHLQLITVAAPPDLTDKTPRLSSPIKHQSPRRRLSETPTRDFSSMRLEDSAALRLSPPPPIPKLEDSAALRLSPPPSIPEREVPIDIMRAWQTIDSLHPRFKVRLFFPAVFTYAHAYSLKNKELDDESALHYRQSTLLWALTYQMLDYLGTHFARKIPSYELGRTFSVLMLLFNQVYLSNADTIAYISQKIHQKGYFQSILEDWDSQSDTIWTLLRGVDETHCYKLSFNSYRLNIIEQIKGYHKIMTEQWKHFSFFQDQADLITRNQDYYVVESDERDIVSGKPVLYWLPTAQSSTKPDQLPDRINVHIYPIDANLIPGATSALLTTTVKSMLNSPVPFQHLASMRPIFSLLICPHADKKEETLDAIAVILSIITGYLPPLLPDQSYKDFRTEFLRNISLYHALLKSGAAATAQNDDGKRLVKEEMTIEGELVTLKLHSRKPHVEDLLEKEDEKMAKDLEKFKEELVSHSL